MVKYVDMFRREWYLKKETDLYNNWKRRTDEHRFLIFIKGEQNYILSEEGEKIYIISEKENRFF